MTTELNFNLETFIDLAMAELPPGRTMIGKDDLSADEMTAFDLLFEHAGEPIGELNTDELLLIECDETGILQRVFSPAVFALEDENGNASIALRVGSNLFPVVPQKGSLKVGNLEGFINFEEKENLEGKKYKIASCAFTDSDEAFCFNIPVKLDAEKEWTQPKLQKLINNGESIAPFLLVAGKGGGTTIRMHELGSGEWLVEEITKLTLDKDGVTRIAYVLHLAGGVSVWDKGRVSTVLKDGRWWANKVQRKQAKEVNDVLKLSIPVTLKVGAIEPAGSGYSVACQLVERTPNLLDAAPVQAQIEAAKPKQKQLVGAVANGSSEVIQAQFDEIPF